jgi:sortase A
MKQSSATKGERSMRRFIRFIGYLMIVTGLGFLGWFAWQYWGTNIISQQKQQEILDDWENSDAIGILRVPRFGADYEVPIVPGSNLVDAKGREALTRGVAWYEMGQKPGEIGNFVVAGHRVTHGEPFADFPKLKAGDKVNVETRESIFTYVLRNGGTDIIVPFTVSWPLAEIPDPDQAAADAEPTQALMTMVTCSELFHTANRSVVIGDLRSTRDKASGRITSPE